MKFVAEIVKTDSGVVISPVWNSDADEVAKLKQNTRYKFEVKQPRNLEFHKKYFALMRLGFSNQDWSKNFDDYREVMLKRAGFYRTINTPYGTEYKTENISFDNMDQSKFESVYDGVLEVICGDLGISDNIVNENLENFF